MRGQRVMAIPDVGERGRTGNERGGAALDNFTGHGKGFSSRINPSFAGLLLTTGAIRGGPGGPGLSDPRAKRRSRKGRKGGDFSSLDHLSSAELANLFARIRRRPRFCP